jgi:methylmalonic aciduria homocystinuria type C protein
MFNETVPTAERLTDFGRHALAAIIGNTRFIWQRFRAVLALEPSRLADTNPLDRYVEDSIHRACESLSVRTAIFWAHIAAPRALPIQRIAQVAGLASLSPSHFSIHPTYGPWMGLRAIVVFDTDAPNEEPHRGSNPCEQCSQPCMPPMREAFARAERNSLSLAEAIRSDWRSWARVRQVCPIGQQEQYSEEQLEYHYTNDKSLLSSH